MPGGALILASGSASRAALLRGAGLDVRIVSPGVDEDAARTALRAERVSVADQAMHLAGLKALKVSSAEPGLVIGGDQMLDCEGEAYDKPADRAAAAQTLLRLQGRTHTLETALVIAEGGRIVWRHLARPQLTMRSLSVADIDAYLDAAGDRVLTSVGAYQLESVGLRLFASVDGDFFSILGVPLLPLCSYLRDRKVILW